MREALLMHEEALRSNRMCRELRKKDILQEVLRLSHDRSLNKYADVDDEDDFQVCIRKFKEWLLFTLNGFQEVFLPPPVMPATTYQLTLAFPDFTQYKVSDLFKRIGHDKDWS